MADTNYPTGDPLAVKLWSKMLTREALYRTYAFRFMDREGNAPIHIKPDTEQSAGDQVTFGLRMQLTGDGITGDGQLEGQEEALVTYSDAIIIDQLRHAVRSAGRISEQRVHFSVRKEALDGLADWWSARIDTWFFNQICGNTITGVGIAYTGMQAATAPSSTRHKIAGGKADEDALTSSDTFKITEIDKVVEAARTTAGGDVLLRPIRIDGNDRFVMFMHEYQRTSLRTEAGNQQWLEIQKAVYMGTRQENPIYWGSLGEYNGAVLHPTDRVPNGRAAAGGTAITTVRRAVLVGAQAASMAYGMGDGPSRYTWVEQTFDYGNKLGVAAGCISGLKKNIFNSKDYAAIVLSSYAAAA